MPVPRPHVNLVELASRIEKLQESMEYDGCDRCGGPVLVAYELPDGMVTAACRNDYCGWAERREP